MSIEDEIDQLIKRLIAKVGQETFLKWLRLMEEPKEAGQEFRRFGIISAITRRRIAQSGVTAKAVEEAADVEALETLLKDQSKQTREIIKTWWIRHNP